jgi:hypothetical protein
LITGHGISCASKNLRPGVDREGLSEAIPAVLLPVSQPQAAVERQLEIARLIKQYLQDHLVFLLEAVYINAIVAAPVRSVTCTGGGFPQLNCCLTRLERVDFCPKLHILDPLFVPDADFACAALARWLDLRQVLNT